MPRISESVGIARRSTCFLSCPGHLDAGPALHKYIEDVSVPGTVTRVPITAVVREWKGFLHFRTREIGCENSIAPAIPEIAGGMGITGRMTSSFMKRFDTFPPEELYRDQTRYV